MIPILAGLTAALCWGLSTVVASRSTRILGSQQALAYVFGLGLPIVLVAALATGLPAHAGPRSLSWAVLAGVASAVGLSLMYQALRLGKVGVVAPIASTEGALAALFAIALGERLTVGVAISLAVVAVGVVVVTMRGRASDVHLRPSAFALAAACCFGVGLVGSSRAGDTLGPFWTILVARIIGVAIVVGPLVARGSLRLPGRAWWMVTFSAVAELVGFTAFVAGSHRSVAIPAVLASQFAAIAAVTSYFVFGERIGRRQIAGALVIIAGVGALAALRS